MTCAACGIPFEPRRTGHRFCSAKCRLAGFQQRRELKRRERDVRIKLLLTEALGLLES